MPSTKSSIFFCNGCPSCIFLFCTYDVSQTGIFIFRYNTNSSFGIMCFFCEKTPQKILPLFYGTFWAFMRPACHICPAWKPGLVEGASCVAPLRKREEEERTLPASVPTLPRQEKKRQRIQASQRRPLLSLSFPLAVAGRPGHTPTKEPFFRQRPLHPGRKGGPLPWKKGDSAACLWCQPPKGAFALLLLGKSGGGRGGLWWEGGTGNYVEKKGRKGKGVWGSAAV